MFTTCTRCGAIYRINVETLRAADGEVECGHCGATFNALQTLADAHSAQSGVEAANDFALEDADTDNVLPFPLTPLAETTRNAELDVHDLIADADDAAALEFTLPPTELDRIFVDFRSPAAAHPTQEPPQPPDSYESYESYDSHESDTSQESREPHETTAASHATPAPFDVGIRADAIEAAAATRMATTAAAPTIEDAAPPTPDPLALEFGAGDPRLVRRWWVAGAAALGLLLLAQLVHVNRERLATNAVLGDAVRATYRAVGRPIPPAIDLAAFEVRQWGITGDTNVSGALTVRASVINAGTRREPPPLLRLVLADRFGTKVGTRDFQPREYLHRDPDKAFEPGDRADVTLEIVDPGRSAEGFEIDLCARKLDARIVCANDLRRDERSP